MTNDGKNCKMTDIRRIVPFMLLFLPLLSTPLQWQKLFVPHVPFWGEVQGVTPAVLGLFAAAALCLAPERLRRVWQIRRLRALVILAGAGVFTACLHKLIYSGPVEYIFTSFFYFLLPVAGVVYAVELKRLMPYFAAVLLIPALIVTCRDPELFGWAGNWNWNFSLLAVCFSACLLFLWYKKPQVSFFWGPGIIAFLLAAVSFYRPSVTPRGTFAGIIVATLCLLVCRNTAPRRRWAFVLWATLLTAVLFTGSVGNIFERIRDSRFQLWRGSLDCTLAHLPLGVGFDRFESMVNPYLPEIYHFTAFAAPRHPHPHNELLSYASSSGLAGAAFFGFLALIFLRGVRFRDRHSVWLGWIVLLLGIHGQFDVLIKQPQIGSLFLLGAGVLAANGIIKTAPGSKEMYASAAKIAAVLFVLTGVLLGVCTFRGGVFLREARIALLEKNIQHADLMLKKSLDSHVTGDALYTAGAVALFNLRDPDKAIGYLERIKSELGLPMIYHSNSLLGRAWAVKGEYAKAVSFFDEELKYYPFSALASGLRLSVLRQIKTAEFAASEEYLRFSTQWNN